MELLDNGVKQIIISIYDSLTGAEHQIADYFLNATGETDLSAKAVSQKLFVSMASLTRFAKKCGFSGYREFAYEYSVSSHPVVNTDQAMRSILHHYQRILSDAYHAMDKDVLQSVATAISHYKTIFLYGMGSSAAAVEEMRYRFMRLGINMIPMTDTQLMKMNQVNLKAGVLLIGVSISANQYVRRSIKIGKIQGATTVLITTNKDAITGDFLDYLVLIPTIGKIEIGNVISPVFPILLAIDVLYADSLIQSPERILNLQKTVNAGYREALGGVDGNK